MFWGRARKAKACVRRFVEALNARDFDSMSALMADHFSYRDGLREGLEGRDRVLAALRGLIETDPEFAIRIHRMSYKDGHVLMAGTITSTHIGLENSRAVWCVVCEDERLSQWESWADGLSPLARASAQKKASYQSR